MATKIRTKQNELWVDENFDEVVEAITTVPADGYVVLTQAGKNGRRRLIMRRMIDHIDEH